MVKMWEHPAITRTRKQRAAFTQATQNKLPRNVVNKIFSYREAANYLKNMYRNNINNKQQNAYTRWLVNSNSNSNLNLSNKLKMIHEMMINFDPTAARIISKHLNLIKSMNDARDLKNFIRNIRMTTRRLNYDEKTKLIENSTLRKFLKHNSNTRNKVFNAFSQNNTYPKIIGLIGNRQDMLITLKNRINKKILGVKETIANHKLRLEKVQKNLNQGNRFIRIRDGKPGTKNEIQNMMKRRRASIEMMENRVKSHENKKRKLENLTTATLRNHLSR